MKIPPKIPPRWCDDCDRWVGENEDPNSPIAPCPHGNVKHVFTLAEVRERERAAFVAGAAAWQVRLQNGAFIGGADLQTWAEAEALRRFPKEA